MIRTQVTFTQEQIDLLKEAAYKEDISVAEIVRRAVDEKFEKEVMSADRIKDNIGLRLLTIAKDAKRRGVRGPKDLSTNVDHYLYGAPKKK